MLKREIKINTIIGCVLIISIILLQKYAPIVLIPLSVYLIFKAFIINKSNHLSILTLGIGITRKNIINRYIKQFIIYLINILFVYIINCLFIYLVNQTIIISILEIISFFLITLLIYNVMYLIFNTNKIKYKIIIILINIILITLLLLFIINKIILLITLIIYLLIIFIINYYQTIKKEIA